jgi:hypothetical protein
VAGWVDAKAVLWTAYSNIKMHNVQKIEDNFPSTICLMWWSDKKCLENKNGFKQGSSPLMQYIKAWTTWIEDHIIFATSHKNGQFYSTSFQLALGTTNSQTGFNDNPLEKLVWPTKCLY